MDAPKIKLQGGFNQGAQGGGSHLPESDLQELYQVLTVKIREKSL